MVGHLFLTAALFDRLADVVRGILQMTSAQE
jgi:hypothetical protein